MPRPRKTGPDRVRGWPSLNVKVPPELLARLRAASETLDLPAAALLREALEERLHADRFAAKEARRISKIAREDLRERETSEASS